MWNCIGQEERIVINYYTWAMSNTAATALRSLAMILFGDSLGTASPAI